MGVSVLKLRFRLSPEVQLRIPVQSTVGRQITIVFFFRSNVSARRGGQTKQRPEAKMPLQTIHMTTENQIRVKELLRELQGQDLAPESELV